MEILREVMGYKRFLFLLHCIRFDDRRNKKNSRICQTSCYTGVNIYIYYYCKKIYSLGKYITIVENLEEYRGRCGFIQCMPNKPARMELYIIFYMIPKHNTPIILKFTVGNNQIDSVTLLIQQLGLSIYLRATSREIIGIQPHKLPFSFYPLLEHQITLIGTFKKNKNEIPN